MVKNPGFESGVILPYWAYWPNESTFANIDNINAYDGNFCARLNSEKVYFYQPVNLEPNTTYTVSATIKSESGDSILFGVSNVYSSGGSTRYFSNTNYETQTWSFTTDESPGNDPNIYFWKDIGSGIVWVDSVVLIKEPQVIQPAPPGGFITYYVSPLGDDSNTGISPGDAWQTIDKVNSTDFGPADEILFEGGKTFYGTIVFNSDDHGTTGNEVLIGSYGTGRATINAQTGSGLIAYDCNNVSVKKLNFIGAGRLNGNTGNGITFSYCSDITIDSVEVSGFQHSGLKINSLGQNYSLKNIHSHDNGYAGIYISGLNKSALSNIYIGNSIADNNPGDPTVLDNHSGNGIFAFNASNVSIEYCKASNNGWDMPRIGNGPGGIWVAEADSVIIQYCISHDNKTSSGSHDGLGFDLDGGITNSIIQYCLSYNNDGAGYGIFQYPGASVWENNIVRYCISENDGNVSAPGSILFWNGPGDKNEFKGFEFYNNVVYNTNGPALAFLDHKNSNFNFRNNIFVSKLNSVYNGINGENFQGNCWYSLNGQFYLDSLIDFEQWAQENNQEMLNGEIVGMFANPMLINPGNSMLTDPAQMSSVDDYKVNVVSPVINSALDLKSIFSIDPGPQDYFGTSIKQGSAFDIGIYEYFDTTQYVQEVSLSSGWNIMSFRLIPNDLNLLNILQPLIDAGKLKKVMDESGNVIEDWGNFGGWQNTVGFLKNTEGYKVNVASASTLQMDGIAVQLSYDIPLFAGWNIISWPSPNEQNGIDVFQSLISLGKLKKVMDESGNVIEDWGTFGGWQNFIGNFKPGEGYKVNVTANCTLTIHENQAKSVELTHPNKSSTHFIPAYAGNGTDHMNINLVNLDESGIIESDEIGVFDGNICVGSAKITNLFPMTNLTSISIPVSALDGMAENNGFTAGNEITVKLFRNGSEYPLVLKPLNSGNTVFGKGSSLFAKVDISTGLSDTENKLIVKCFPNSFKTEVNISVASINSIPLNIVVYNLDGQKIKTIYNGIIDKSRLFKWNGTTDNNTLISSGMYIIMINNNPNKVIFNGR